MKNTLLFLCALLVVPSVLRAQVIINEVAWMGTAVSANDEWIELYNVGIDTISLAGWSVKAQDGEPSITLKGEIPANGYFLLERSDDDSVPNVSAGVIYTGGLGNAGEILDLFDSSGTIVDSVVSGSGWSLGGDNVTKNTPQRQTLTSWITGVPTPGAQNTTYNIEPGAEVQGTSTPSTTPTTGTTQSFEYVPKVFAYAGENFQTVAGGYAFFEGHAVDPASNRVESVHSFTWSFGDGSIGKEKEEAHIYTFPGTYTAVLTVESQNQHIKDSVSVRVMKADVVISSVLYGEDGYIEINNVSNEPLDVSLWKLKTRYISVNKRGNAFTIPYTTTIAPHTKVPFPSSITKLRFTESDALTLVSPNGKVVSSFEGPAYTPSLKESEKVKRR